MTNDERHDVEGRITLELFGAGCPQCAGFHAALQHVERALLADPRSGSDLNELLAALWLEALVTIAI